MDNTTQGANRRSRRNRLSRFVFTLNNWSEEEYESLKVFALTTRWFIMGKETGLERETRHLQGACVIGKQMEFSSLKRIRGLHRAHIEAMRGTPEDSKKYCSKEDNNPFESGDIPQPGKRSDLHDVCDKINAGATILDLARDEDARAMGVVIRHFKGIQNLIHLRCPKRDCPPEVIWIYGATGVGKTRCAIEFAELVGRGEFWISKGTLRWFDGYCGQRVVILDDLRTRHAQFSFLLRLLDRYPMSVEFKGGYTSWTPQLIFITCPKHPEQMWSLRSEEDKEQLVRRCSWIEEATDYDDIRAKLMDHLETTDLLSGIDGGDICSDRDEEEEEELSLAETLSYYSQDVQDDEDSNSIIYIS